MMMGFLFLSMWKSSRQVLSNWAPYWMSTFYHYGVCILMSLLKDPQAKTLLFILDFAQPKGSCPYPAILWEGIAGSPDTSTQLFTSPLAL